MEIWVDEDVNSYEANSDEEKFPFLNGSFEKEEGKENDKKREGIEQDDGICEGNQGDGFEQTKKREGSKKSS